MVLRVGDKVGFKAHYVGHNLAACTGIITRVSKGEVMVRINEPLASKYAGSFLRFNPVEVKKL